MRPTDENQAESMRPNLMSPKRVRTSGEDSILAMLERDPARKRGAGAGAGASSRRLAWYGASAVVAVGLTGALVWLAAGNDGQRPDVERSMMAAAPPPPPVAERPAPAPAPALVQVALAPEARPAARAGSAAVIVDQKPQDEAPPLRLLKPAPGAPAKASAPPAAAAVKPAPKTAVAAAPARTPAAAATAPRPRPVTVARNAVRPAPAKAQRPGAPARAAEGPLDPDVALISAVIVHANGHAPEGSQMTELLCPNDSCQARPNRQ